MDEKKVMKYEFTKLSLNAVIYVAVQSAIEGLATMFLPKSSRKAVQNLAKVCTYMVTEIVAGGLGSVVEEEIDGIKEYYEGGEECQTE